MDFRIPSIPGLLSILERTGQSQHAFAEFRSRAQTGVSTLPPQIESNVVFEPATASDCLTVSAFGVTVSFVYRPGYDKEGTILRGTVRVFRVGSTPFDNPDCIGEFSFNPRSGLTDLPAQYGDTIGLVDHAHLIVLGFLDAAIPRASAAT